MFTYQIPNLLRDCDLLQHSPYLTSARCDDLYRFQEKCKSNGSALHIAVAPLLHHKFCLIWHVSTSVKYESGQCPAGAVWPLPPVVSHFLHVVRPSLASVEAPRSPGNLLTFCLTLLWFMVLAFPYRRHTAREFGASRTHLGDNIQRFNAAGGGCGDNSIILLNRWREGQDLKVRLWCDETNWKGNYAKTTI